MKTKALPALLLFMMACHTAAPPGNGQQKTAAPPAAGTIVAADSMAFNEDPLNPYFFSVKLRVSDSQVGGEYEILAGYGPQKAVGNLAMPKGAPGLKPLLRRDTAVEYGYIIGFIAGPEYGGDSTFLPYYAVSAKRGEISIKQVKDYQFRDK